MAKSYTAHSIEEAWAIADKLFPSDYMHDSEWSERAGYPVYVSTNSDMPLAHINDLNARLEVVLPDYTCINIWIEFEQEQTQEQEQAIDVKQIKAAVRYIEAAYSERRAESPSETVTECAAHIGKHLFTAALATLVNRYAWDGRIDRRVAQWAENVSGALDEQEAVRRGIYSGKIHIAHLNQIARAAMQQ